MAGGAGRGGDGGGGRGEGEMIGHVAFDNVCFSYPSRPDVDVHILKSTFYV
jgi:hypothetical protein